MANDYASLFNMKNSVQEPQTVRNSDEYKVSFKDGKGGVYQSIIRFIPWYANPEKSIIQKTVSWVKNPLTQQGMYVDDPRSVGLPSPIIDMFFKLRNTNDARFQEFGKNHFSSKPQYASLVQIIQDEQHPELVGQIKVFKFGKKIWEKLYAEEHPAVGQGTVPFHPIYGRYFLIKCVGQSNFNNFDQSYFFDMKGQNNQVLPMGMWYINPATNQYETVTENTDQQAVFNYLQTASPDLAKYDYQPWTADQEKFVNDALEIAANYLQTGTLQSNLATVNTPSGIAVNPAPVFPGATAPAAPQAPAAPSVMPAMPSMPAPAAPAQVQMAPAAPQAPSMGAFSMGQGALGGMPTPPAAPQISGVQIPTVEPATAPQGNIPNFGGAIGSVDDVLANI